MSERRQKLIGKRYGRGVVTSLIGKDKYNCYVWELVCDCGKTYKSTTGNLNYGHVISCGCYRLERVIENAKKATAAITMSQGMATMRELFRSYQKRALTKGLAFEITQEQFEQLTKKDCVYCGQSPATLFRAGHKNGEYVYNGIDRVDSAVGYTLENSVPCCKRCNQAKNNMSYEEFMSWVARVYSHSCVIQDKEVRYVA